MRCGHQCPTESSRFPAFDIMKYMAQASGIGSSFFAMAAMMFSWVCALDNPVNIRLVLAARLPPSQHR